ncbi:MAG: translesion DNA synthesis-associated protein ImuA [Gammaproteobacteria bacterium]|nr:translesion DNA synthesis-associated protein ImuA [Gammaproteobacteria bacterium]MDH5800959.1 translesion DNA synthesis-associated protein ImuA [Gammaproteobacteria bacterium]
MNEQLQQLLRNNQAIWKAGEAVADQQRGIPSGYPSLDAILPNQGWPTGTLVEMVTPCWGVGELQVLMPMIRSMTQAGQYVLWIAPPHVPYAPALVQAGVDTRYIILVTPDAKCQDTLWCIEKALQSQECALVLAWLDWLPNSMVRRLQLAATASNTLGVLFRQRNVKDSPSALRLQLSSGKDGTHITVLKARRGYQYQSATLDFICH